MIFWAIFLSCFSDSETPLRWKKLTAHWPPAHRPWTNWNQRVDDADSHLPCHQPIRRMLNIKKYSQPRRWDFRCIWQKFLGLRPGSGEGNGTPLQYSCLENPMDGGAWWATVHEVALDTTERLPFNHMDSNNCAQKSKCLPRLIAQWILRCLTQKRKKWQLDEPCLQDPFSFKTKRSLAQTTLHAWEDQSSQSFRSSP